MTDRMTEDELVFQILDNLRDGTVDSEALSQLLGQAFASPDAHDYFEVLCGNPLLVSACQEVVTSYKGVLSRQRDSLKTALQDRQASLDEVRILLANMQRIPTVVSRDLLKQMVLLVLMQHGAKEVL
ncbi:MAG TPA: hypothetical protein VMT34_01025 [Aggregatilineales bacterium]|nr:hypothetical protein [Aggregatilineales bacterium]